MFRQQLLLHVGRVSVLPWVLCTTLAQLLILPLPKLIGSANMGHSCCDMLGGTIAALGLCVREHTDEVPMLNVPILSTTLLWCDYSYEFVKMVDMTRSVITVVVIVWLIV